MKLKKLLNESAIEVYRGSKEVEITGLCSHSKFVAPGDLFFAKKGHSDDGARYIEQAVESGASAVLADMGNPFLKNTVQLIHPHVAAIEGKLARIFYEDPGRELLTVGVTGTSGKTSVTYLIKHLLDGLGLLSGLIGTIEYNLGKNAFPASLTTPDVITNHKLMREMCKQGCRAAVMEVSSHALDQHRVDEIPFDVAVFTNLSHEHLDYHHTMEAYAQAKTRLFSSLAGHKTAVVNGEDPWTKTLLQACVANTLSYGFAPSNDLFAERLKLSAEGTRFDAVYRGERLSFSTSLLGRYNVLNCLAALGVLLTQGVPFASLPPLIRAFPGVPGRLERVGTSNIFIDYSHKPAALKNVLSTLRELTTGRLLVVFGCGGDRDREKRPQMAEIAEQIADVMIITSDNPRSEEPSKICAEIARGCKRKEPIIELDRTRAISRALDMAKREDLILIAGKGHEKVQVFAHHTIPFDDCHVVEHLITQ